MAHMSDLPVEIVRLILEQSKCPHVEFCKPYDVEKERNAFSYPICRAKNIGLHSSEVDYTIFEATKVCNLWQELALDILFEKERLAERSSAAESSRTGDLKDMRDLERKVQALEKGLANVESISTVSTNKNVTSPIYRPKSTCVKDMQMTRMSGIKV